MTTTPTHAPGSFCWIELATTDTAGGKAFYTKLFGWTVNEIPMGEGLVYTIFRDRARDAAAMYRMDNDARPNWLSYVAVSSVDTAVEKAKELGASVVAGPADVADSGRFAALIDPQGAPFAVWQPNKHIGVGVRDEPNALCWNELQVRDADAARTFYPALFGWRMKESPEYTEWHLGEHAIGGMLASQAPPEVPPYWLPYFAVADCDVTVATAQSLGGGLIVPPMDIEHVGRFAVLADPQGAVFAVIKLAM
jgi:predicted enzyme related to lactoylglutathione lyase